MDTPTLTPLPPEQEDWTDDYARAANSGAKIFLQRCPVHGITEHRTNSRRCVQCHKIGAPRKSEARADARGLGLRRYQENCAIHGMTEFFVSNGKCASCFTSQGFTRHTPHPETARAEARAAGKDRYEAPCLIHGEAWHSAAHGKCLECYTVEGTRRLRTLPAHMAERRVAQLNGNAEYLATCPSHGYGPFHVRTGKCAACFDRAGRPRNVRLPSPRAYARRQGHDRYLGLCPVHGENSPLSVAHGKCLRCFTTMGLTRRNPV